MHYNLLIKNKLAVSDFCLKSKISQRNSTIDWVVVGQRLGKNRHVKHMNLALNVGHEDYNLIAFCEGIVCNTSIVALEVKLFVDVSGELPALKPPVIEELHLKEVIKSDLVMRSLSLFLACNKQLKTLTFPKYDSNAITIEGWTALATVLENHTGIEEICFDLPNSRSLGRDENQFLIAKALRENTSLKKVTIPICSTSQLMCIAQLVKSPNCRLEELNVHYFQNQIDQQINLSVECIQLTQIAVD